jgi:uncharacterized membrane protein
MSPEMTPHRLEAFSDGVLAVIITIMAFDLRTPVTADLHGLSARVPALLIYLLSFSVVGIYWNNHHHLLRATQQISSGVMMANLHLLLWLSLVPFATSWIGADHNRSVPAATYGVVTTGAAISYFLLTRMILRANPKDVALRTAVGKDVKGTASLVISALGIALAAISPYLAYGAYATVTVMWLVPDRRLSQTTMRATAEEGLTESLGD